MSTLNKWDTEEAPQLRAIELCSKKSAYYARFVTAAINVLSSVPNFETRAHDEMKKARDDIAETLARFDAALHRYHALEAAE